MPHSIAHILSGAALRRFAATLAAIPLALVRFAHLARERRALARLDRHGLDDIGLDPTAARYESGRAFWDVPNHWRL